MRHMQALFFSDAQLCSCHQCFSHYRQPPSLNLTVLIFKQCEAANAKALIFLDLVHPTHGSVAIHATVLLRSWVGHNQHARGVSLIM